MRHTSECRKEQEEGKEEEKRDGGRGVGVDDTEEETNKQWEVSWRCGRGGESGW